MGQILFRDRPEELRLTMAAGRLPEAARTKEQVHTPVPTQSRVDKRESRVDKRDITGRQGSECLQSKRPRRRSPSSGASEPNTPKRDAGAVRAKAPTRNHYTRGSADAVAHTELSALMVDTAISAYESGKTAATSAGTLASRLKWWTSRAEARGIELFPLTVEAVQHAGAMLMAGGYRSGPLYFSAMKREHTRLGHQWSPQLSQEIADGTRSLMRGRGPDKQSGFVGVDQLLKRSSQLEVALSGAGLVGRLGLMLWVLSGFLGK
jgi:hypothetical protein